jgi:hypothetical protein
MAKHEKCTLAFRFDDDNYDVKRERLETCLEMLFSCSFMEMQQLAMTRTFANIQIS